MTILTFLASVPLAAEGFDLRGAVQASQQAVGATVGRIGVQRTGKPVRRLLARVARETGQFWVRTLRGARRRRPKTGQFWVRTLGPGDFS